jgi:hypothetical protein
MICVLSCMQEPEHVQWVGDLGRYAGRLEGQQKLHDAVNSTVSALRGQSPDIVFFIVPRRGALLASLQHRCYTAFTQCC